MSDFRNLLLFSGNAHPALAAAIAKNIGMPLSDGKFSRFPDGEADVEILCDVRGADVFVIQPTCPPVDTNLMELLVIIDALKRASAGRITAVIPYSGYARQDRKDRGRVPITARLVADIITTAGANRVLTVDLHASQIQGFFNIPCDHLYARNAFAAVIDSLELDNPMFAGPDVSAMRLARAYSKTGGTPIAGIDKRRVSGRKTQSYGVVGDVRDRDLVIVDDLVSTASSMRAAFAAYKKAGANRIALVAAHGVCCGPAVTRLNKIPFHRIVFSDSIPMPKRLNNAEQWSIAPMLGEAIKRIHNDQSVSALFEP